MSGAEGITLSFTSPRPINFLLESLIKCIKRIGFTPFVGLSDTKDSGKVQGSQ